MSAVRLQVELALKQVLWELFNRHRPVAGVSDIAVVGSRRSGSTLIMQVLAANRKVKYCNQPLSLFSGSSDQIRRLPIFDSGQFIALDEEEAEQLHAYFQDIQEGRNHVNENWRFWQPTFDFQSNRIVFKVTDGHHLIDWFETALGYRTLSLIRHPISQSLSVIRNGWQGRYKGFLRSPAFRALYLEPKGIVSEAEEIAVKGSLLQRHVLGWCCENIGLLSANDGAGRSDVVSYEHFTLAPEPFVKAFAAAFQLADTDRMLEAAGQRSLSTKRKLSSSDTNALIDQGDKEALIERWRTSLKPGEEEAAFTVLDLFGIDVYERGNALPAKPSSFLEGANP